MLSLQGDVVSWSAFAVGSGTEEAPFGFGDGDVVDAGFAAAHETVVVEFPELLSAARNTRRISSGVWVLIS